ncbi:vWA domain-containing protein [Catenuloplanes japonicus]|uniref:vWA domain-containing protein n=1 Tax=Catenuloplanes japonicus TaxID=33876 RepID=UPI000526495F|nr:von Willebrand factor type A domain-containing protein [Catenuloplanes japonicus]
MGRYLRLPASALVIMLALSACGANENAVSDAGLPAAQAVPPAAAESAGPESAPEIDPARTPESTFAMDVDTASYDYARNLILQGLEPGADGIRPEEFINSFRQDYPQPDGDGFSITMDGARLPDGHRVTPEGGDVRLLRVGLQASADNAATRQDARLTFVVDVSGSMGEQGKLDVVKEALRAFAERARPTDEIAIVTFSDDAELIREMSPLRERNGLLDAIDGLRATNGTNLEKGLTRGYEVARAAFRAGATNRVVLVSDALANSGNTAPEDILAQVREAAAKQITLLGVGVGNDYGDRLMEELADNGDGFTVYVSGSADARETFVEQLPAAVPVRALDAKVQVTFDPGTVAGYRLIGYDNRLLDAREFRDDTVDGGEVMAGHSVTALYLVRLRPGASGTIAHTQLRWQDPGTRQAQESGADVAAATLAGGFDRSATGLQVCYVAAWFAEQLRHSDQGNAIGRGDLITLADAAATRTADPAVAELATLIRRNGD